MNRPQHSTHTWHYPVHNSAHPKTCGDGQRVQEIWSYSFPISDLHPPLQNKVLFLRAGSARSRSCVAANLQLMDLDPASQLDLQMLSLAQCHRSQESSASMWSMGFGLAFLMWIIGLDHEIGAGDYMNWEPKYPKGCRSPRSVSVQFIFFLTRRLFYFSILACVTFFPICKLLSKLVKFFPFM